MNGSSGVRLAELLGAMSLATDLGLGQPMEHILRSSLIAVGVGEQMGFDDQTRADTYYLSLIAWVGCTADSYEVAAWFGDDLAFRSDTYEVDFTGLPFFRWLLRHAGSGGTPWHRARLAAALVATGGKPVEGFIHTHCQVASQMAVRLGLGPGVTEGLTKIFARWDGKGLPSDQGDEIPLPVRVMHVADVVEVHHREHGAEAALEEARRRSGTQFDPAVVAALAEVAGDVLGALRDDSSWDDVIAAEPGLRTALTEAELDTALEAIADFTDLKSPFFGGHSRGVADLAARAAEAAGHGAANVIAVRRAGLLHDLGRAGVPNTIWDKPGPLTASEWERARMHAYYADRMLRRPEALAQLGAIASTDHERLDGSGYHRSLPAGAIPALGRILAAADAYHAMGEPRPHRPALSPVDAASQLRAEARAGALDAAAVDAVLAAAGHRHARPSAVAGLTPRELEVLVLVARGASTRQVAKSLGIAPKTAGTHIERIYVKIGASTRAAAALFAMEHGLLDSLRPLEP